MTTVADVLNFLETVAPVHMKCEWDRVGLNCGHLAGEVKTVLVALDPFMDVCKEAKAVNADLLLTHHPLIWNAGFVTDETVQGQNTLFLIENNIAHINAHTNLDCAPGGVNDCLAGALGLSDVSVIEPVGTDSQGRDYGLLRQGSVSRQSLSDFLKLVKDSLGCTGLRYTDAGKVVEKVAVGGGACGSELQQAVRAGCDTFVTADVKYNQFRDAFDLGLNLIDAGHFHTENPVCAYLSRELSEAFPEITVLRSRCNTDCAKFFP